MKQRALHPASHCPLIVLSRSDGRSSVAAAAYAARTRMVDERTGLIHNYSRVPGLLGEGLVHWNGSAEELWNAAEASEKRKNARVARELRPALPAELPLDDQLSLVRGFCLFLKDRYGVASHWVVHAPTFHDKNTGKRLWKGRDTDAGRTEYHRALSDKDITNLNFHAHIRWTVREVDRGSGTFGDKTHKLDRRPSGPEEVKLIRAEWERRTNAALKKAGSSARIDLRSYKDMAKAGDAPEGLRAQEHVGPIRTAKHRAAIVFFDEPMVTVRNAIVRDENETRWEAWFELRRLAREKARLEGESARIALENERRRREQAERDKQKVREAANEAELNAAILGAGAIDMTRSKCPMEAAMRWAESAEEAPGDLTDEFSHKVDLEAASEPEATETRGERLRVRRVVRGRVRVRN